MTIYAYQLKIKVKINFVARKFYDFSAISQAAAAPSDSQHLRDQLLSLMTDSLLPKQKIPDSEDLYDFFL